MSNLNNYLGSHLEAATGVNTVQSGCFGDTIISRTMFNVANIAVLIQVTLNEQASFFPNRWEIKLFIKQSQD